MSEHKAREREEEIRNGAIIEEMAQKLAEGYQVATVEHDPRLDMPWDQRPSSDKEAWRCAAVIALREAPILLADPQSAEGMVITTLYSRSEYKPIVQIDLGKPIKLLQIEAKAVQKFAIHLIEAAEGAMSDAFLIEFMKRYDLSEDDYWGFIRAFREWRGAKIGGQPEQQDEPHAVIATDQ